MAAATGGCRAPKPYAIERLVVSESLPVERLAGAGLPPERLSELARQTLAGAPGFTDRPEGARQLLAQLAVERAEAFSGGPGSTPVAQVAVTLELSSRDGEPARHGAGAAAEPLADGPAALRLALERAASAAIAKAVNGVALELAAERKSTSELVRDLDAPDAAVRDQAVRALADRGARDAVPALIRRLRDPDPAVVERAVGALAQLHDPRAAVPLIELARHRDPPYVAQLARLVGDVGGPDARAWLLTMSAGHPDEVVRGAARAALADLSAREAQARANPR